jgi:opacity protein-like surface antigen
MKNLLIALLAVSSVFPHLVPDAPAVPVGNSNVSREYALGAAWLARWVCGAYFGQRERDIELKNGGFVIPLETEKAMIYAGYDVLSWVTVYAAGGGGEAEFAESGESDGGGEYAFGVQLRLLDKDVLNSTLMEDKLRISSTIQYGSSEAEFFGRDVEWTELYANILLSIVNDVEASKYFNPFSIGLFGGPVLSDLHSDDMDEDSMLGFVGGMEVHYTRSVTLTAGVEYFDEPGFFGGVHIRF